MATPIIVKAAQTMTYETMVTINAPTILEYSDGAA